MTFRLAGRKLEGYTWLTPLGAPAVDSITTNTKTDVNLLTLRVNYKFGGPVVAKY